jgi:glycosyltransferase involved in cell wall biosynthesis
MNILFLANNSLDPLAGGIERTTYNLIRELSKAPEYTVTACFMSIKDKIEGVNCVEKTIYSGKDIYDIIVQFEIDIAIFPCGYWYVNILKAYNPDVPCKIITGLHSPPKVGEDYILSNAALEFGQKSFAEKVKGLPAHTLTYLKHPLHVKKAREGYSKGYHNSDAYVLLSDKFFKDFIAYARLKDAKKLYAIGNALSFDHIVQPEDSNNKDNVVLLVARMDEISKRVSLAIQSWMGLQRIALWTFKLLGSGKDLPFYKKMVAEHNVQHISFEGHTDPYAYYIKSKIFIMTSAFEGWGMTLTEALQTGCVPIVMDSFGALHDIIEHNYNGIIIPNGDVQAMTKAIQTLIDQPEELKRLSLNALKSAENFTIEKVAAKWKVLFQNLMKGAS